MRNLITAEGYGSLISEITRLKTKERMKVANEIEIAREHGDISENAEYIYAKEKQGLLECKIATIEQYLVNAEIVSDPENNERIFFGSIVELLNMETGDKRNYKIVGEMESDVNGGKINYNTPFAKELIGKRSGDEIEFVTPAGDEQYWEILNIE